MTNFQDKHPDTGENSLPLPGFLAIEKKSSGDYDRHYKNTYIMDGKVWHDSVHFGRVIDLAEGVFNNRKLGVFTFSLEKGYGPAPNFYNEVKIKYDRCVPLHFGDIWLVDQIIKKK